MILLPASFGVAAPQSSGHAVRVADDDGGRLPRRELSDDAVVAADLLALLQDAGERERRRGVDLAQRHRDPDRVVPVGHHLADHVGAGVARGVLPVARRLAVVRRDVVGGVDPHPLTGLGRRGQPQHGHGHAGQCRSGPGDGPSVHGSPRFDGVQRRDVRCRTRQRYPHPVACPRCPAPPAVQTTLNQRRHTSRRKGHSVGMRIPPRRSTGGAPPHRRGAVLGGTRTVFEEFRCGLSYRLSPARGESDGAARSRSPSTRRAT